MDLICHSLCACVILGAAVAAQDVKISSGDDTRDAVDDLSVSANNLVTAMSAPLRQDF